jgi:hypothetical protein
LEAVEPADCGFKIEFEARDLELLYEIDGPGEENLPAILDQGQADCGSQMAFSATGQSE